MLDRQKGDVVFECDGCGDVLDTGTGDFSSALSAMRRDGWRAVQLDSITPPKPADYEALRGVVLQDWTDAVMAEQRTAAVRALARKYFVKVEAAK